MGSRWINVYLGCGGGVGHGSPHESRTLAAIHVVEIYKLIYRLKVNMRPQC